MLETFLDVLLIEEIPVENDQATGIVGIDGQQVVRSQKAARKPQTGIVRSCDTKFPWYGLMVDMPYKVGDVVRTNEFGRDYILLNRCGRVQAGRGEVLPDPLRGHSGARE